MTIKLLAEDYVYIPQIVDLIAESLIKEKPFSLVRVGDGENIVLAQEVVFSLEWISANVGWSHSSNYCGVKLPNLAIRDRMTDGLRKADLIGVFATDELTEKAFTALNIKPEAICYAFDNLRMPMYKPFVELMRKYPPLLVGNPAERFAALLKERLGITVSGTVSIKDSDELDSCIEEMALIPHKWSLVSAGCNAVIITPTMAQKYGKVSIDFGHAPDNVMASDFPEYWLATV